MAEQQTKLETGDKENERPEIRRPDYIAKMPIEKGKWTKVGYAYFNPRTETFTVYFDVIPVLCKVVLFRD